MASKYLITADCISSVQAAYRLRAPQSQARLLALARIFENFRPNAKVAGRQ
jgi:hypothetical protein